MKQGSFRICREWYTLQLFAANPNARYVFGDNTERWGRGGQAKVCRDHPQAIGIATLWAPGKFFTDCDEALVVVRKDLDKVTVALKAGHDVYWPEDGIGTGLARLRESAPGIFAFIETARDLLLAKFP